jgi:NADH dehydrogenase
MKKVIVIGGGFAGIQFIKHLSSSHYEVLLIDKLNHHQFQPLFYQVATSQLEPSSISFPLRKIFQRRRNTQIRMAEVTAIDPVQKKVSTDIGDFAYDILVIATGCKTNFFGNEELEKHAYGLKTSWDAIRIRNQILKSFERMLSASEEEKEYLQNIVIVGAGPTGVEMSGALAEIKRNVLPRDYPLIDFGHLNIYLLEGTAHTLNSMSDLSKRSSEKYLRKMGVEFIPNVFVTAYDGRTVVLNDGRSIKSSHVIWTAGVTGNLIPGLDVSVLVKGSRIRVDRYNRVRGYESVYALGDIAYMETPLYPAGHPQVANVAINQAKLLARNLNRINTTKNLKEYEYRNLGSMATVGKNKAVVDLSFIKFDGYFAWFVWMFLHLMLILSVRNKLIIFINWAWAYITRDTSLRLIMMDPEEDKKKSHPAE